MKNRLRQELEAMLELHTGDSFTADNVHTLVNGIFAADEGGGFEFVEYDDNAFPYPQTIGSTAQSISGLGNADESMIDTIFIMPNKGTDPTATLMIVVDEKEPSADPKTYQYVYVGNINDLPSDVLTESSIVNDLTSGGTDKPLSAEQGRTLNSHVNYTTCGSNAGDQVKLISDDGFELSTHLRLLVKMNNTNTHATPKFNINNTGIKDVWYNGAVASDTNTWSAGEVVDVYYDGTRYIANTHGAQFSTGEKVGDVGIDDEPTAGSENLVKSGGVITKINEVTSKIGTYPVTNCLFYNVLNTEDENYVLNKIINQNGNFYPDTYSGYFTSGYIECSSKMRFRGISTSNTEFWACFYNKDRIAISSAFIRSIGLYFEVPDDANISFMRVSMLLEKSGGCLFNSDIPFSTKVEYNKPIVVCDYVAANYIENEILSGIKHRFIENIFNPTDEDIIESAYINPTNGSVELEATTFVTGYIPCKKGDYLAWNNRTNSSLCAFYDSDKVFIQGYYGGQLNPYTTVPSGIGNIAYVRFSVPNSYKTRALYKNNYNASYIEYGNVVIIIDDVFLPDGSLLLKLQNIIQSINTLSTKIENLVFVKNVLNQNDEDYVQNRIINSYGNFYPETYSGYATSGFIPCSSGDIFTILNKASFEYWACFYDSNKTRLSGSHTTVSEFTIPDNSNIKYFRISYNISTKKKFLYNTNYAIQFESDYGKVIGLLESLLIKENLSANVINASQILLNGRDISENIIKWEYACCRPICIGDSLTDGLYVPDSQGHYTQGLVNENYPYFLGRMLNCDVFNAGKNGSYPSKFYTEWYPLLDFTSYDSVFLWLGTNGGLNTADSEAANYTPEKEGYYYTQIIDGILSQNPTIKIVLMTVFIVGEISSSVEHGTVSTTNSFIRDIAQTYNMQVIDMSDLTSSAHPELRNNISNTHFAKAGNVYIANRICDNLRDWFNSNPIRCEFGLTQKPAHNP